MVIVIIIAMITKFVNRSQELELFNARYKNNSFEFIPVYGRRRTGKTELILHFIEDKNAIYFLATAGTKKENIENFKKSAKSIIDLNSIKDDWQAMFEHIKNNIKSRLVIVIDEFPYLVDTEQGLSSMFQSIIDLHLKHSNIFLILCGSSLGMMWKEVLAYKAPLYGRRTGQLEIKPLLFNEVMKFLDKPFEDIIRIYAITGGVPAYLKEFTDNKPVHRLISEKILARGTLLREEPIILLREEFRDPRIYLSILSSLSLGHRKLSEIISNSGFENKTSITPYLQNLENLGYIHRELPVTDKATSKRGLYFINDVFFNFWMRFVRKNMDTIERDISMAGRQIEKEFNMHVAFVFEEVCKQALWKLMPIQFQKLGRWWHKEREIDLVGLNEQEKEILFAECKWQENVNAEKLLHELHEKSKFVLWNNDNRREFYCVMAKSFSSRPKISNVFLFDLKDMEKKFKAD